jgi:Basic region leucine zipper
MQELSSLSDTGPDPSIANRSPSPYEEGLASPLGGSIISGHLPQTHLGQSDLDTSSSGVHVHEKRRRNNAASARFRMKKKEKEKTLEKATRGLSDKLSELEQEVSKLEVENKWLRDIITTQEANNDDGDVEDDDPDA